MLTATVSHDLRTPLNAIIGLTGNLDTYITSEEGKTFFNLGGYTINIPRDKEEA